jgi:hypothetical protein
MNYKRRFDTTIPDVMEKIDEFLELKNVNGTAENEIGTYRGTRASGIPAFSGWATLTVDSSDQQVHRELDDFLRKLEADGR